MSNPVLDQDRVALLANRTVLRKMLLPAWPRQNKELMLVEMEVEWVRFSTLNHRTRAEQLQAVHTLKRSDLFTADPLGREAQTAQYGILKSQDGFQELKTDLKERGQQEPAVLTSEGVLINGNRRSAALRSLYLEDNYLPSKYVQCLVLPSDASFSEIVDLEAELQVAKDFKEDYSWVNEAMLIEELYEREGKDFTRVAKKMHRPLSEVKGAYEKLQQLHQLVTLSNGARLHIDFKENESAFEELSKHIRNKKKAEADAVRSTYFLGTLAGVNYRKLRHLQRPDAADLVYRELADLKALKPLLETVTSQVTTFPENDPLDELLGEPEKPHDLTSLLSFLATKEKNGVITLSDGTTAVAQDVYDTIQGAIDQASSEAEEEERDQSAVSAPLVRTASAIVELNRALKGLPKARQLEGWNEVHLNKNLTEIIGLLEKFKEK